MDQSSAPHLRLHDCVILLNERAGAIVATSIEQVIEAIQSGFEGAAVAVPQIVVCSPDGIAERIRQEVDRGREAIIVGGGDGTVATAAGILRGSATSLGVLPMGTFNLVARDLGIPLELEAAAAALATAAPGRIDVAEVNGRIYLCVCVLGFFPNVVLRRDRYRGLPWWRKVGAITRAMLRSFMDYPSLHLRLESDDKGESAGLVRTRFVAVSNNAYEEELGVIPTKNDLTDGTLAVYISHHRSISELVKGSISFITGSTENDPNLSIHRCQKLRIEPRRQRKLRIMLDGEILILDSPLEFQLHPRELRVLQPAAITMDADFEK